MLIVIDTTEIFDDPYLTGPNWMLIEEFLRTERAQLVVPEIVVQEACNQFPRRLEGAQSEVRRGMRTVRQLLPQHSDLQLPDCDHLEQAARYRETLGARLAWLGAKRQPYGEVDIERVVTRSLERRKPFDAKGQKGFRDVVLWESLLPLFPLHDDTVVLITGNKSDFGEHGSLAPHLQQDLEQLGIPADRVRVCAGLRPFAKEYVLPRLRQMEGIQSAIANGTCDLFNAEEFYDDVRIDLEPMATEMIESLGHCGDGVIGRRHLRVPRLTQFCDEPNEIEVDPVYRVGEDSVVLLIEYIVGGTVTCDEYSPEDPLSKREFTGRVQFRFPVSVSLNIETGEIGNSDCGSVFVQATADWPVLGVQGA